MEMDIENRTNLLMINFEFHSTNAFAAGFGGDYDFADSLEYKSSEE